MAQLVERLLDLGVEGSLVRDSLKVLCCGLKQDTKIILCLVFTGALNSVTTIFRFYLICHKLSCTTVTERLRKHHRLYREKMSGNP